MWKTFACFAPSQAVQSAQDVQVQPAHHLGGRKDARKGIKQACKQCPSRARATGSLECGETDMLHRVQGKRCDLVFMSAKLQDQRIAAWLEQQGVSFQGFSAGQWESEDLLRKLLGAERAQAVMEAVHEGVPYKTVLELPADEHAGLACCAPKPRLSLPAQLALPSGPFPWLSTKFNQLPFFMPSSTQVVAGDFLVKSQQNGDSSANVPGEQSPVEVKAQDSHFNFKPVSAAGFSSYCSSSFSYGSQRSMTPCSGGSSKGGIAPTGKSTNERSSDTSSTTLHNQGSDLGLQRGPFLLPTLGGPTCSTAALQQGTADLPKARPDADLSQSLISKAQGLSNSALDRIQGPGWDKQNSGNYDRTLATLQTLQVDHSPDTSNQPLPSFQAMRKLSCAAGDAILKGLKDEPGSGGRAAALGDLKPHCGATSAACTQPLEAGVCIATHVPAPGEPATLAFSAADSLAPTAEGCLLTKVPLCEERGLHARCSPSDSSVHTEYLLNHKLQGIAEEESSTSCIRCSVERQTPLHRHVSSYTSKGAVEITVRPLQTRPGGSKPLMMVSFADISDQVQVQGFLLSLAESQLLLLSSLLPKHAIDFLARQSSATDAIPQNMAKLARSHEAVTLLFMDICGYTTMAKNVEPQEIMVLLNTFFSILDRLTDQFRVTKVETAGDCYIVSSGVLSSNLDDGFSHTLDHHHAPEASARRVMEFAKAVLHEAAKIMMPHSTDPVQVRVGMHTGNVVSGLVGTKLPKFSIFRDTMNTGSRMESTGVPGRIHVSETTHGLLPEYAWESVGLIPVKGKGNMRTYLWDACKSWSGQPCISTNKPQQCSQLLL
ncbi:adenylate and guanylate cyclase catalytic domain-containing protein [Dunaliella salina]|uniref:Adenylate and guanylate cyclase catalytic domain-containing protein n=1 Tax=Dunaliella salina TaxID=3046 RepID=A0ABQ7GTJ2_DUNSA|nr:adenylate and guanylate cyclase catalytic domain-containing protein [Dunaliella salina]|eukprot:KAF5837932.1 adenylate and guanylate cyclase catalytic domain-containing protein [Dunaliella salina]